MPTNEAEVPPQRLYLIKSPWGLLPTYEKPLLSRHIEYVPASALAEAQKEVWRQAIALAESASQVHAKSPYTQTLEMLRAAAALEAARDAALSAGKGATSGEVGHE